MPVLLIAFLSHGNHEWKGLARNADIFTMFESCTTADAQHRKVRWYPLNACPKLDPNIPLLYPLENLTVNCNYYLKETHLQEWENNTPRWSREEEGYHGSVRWLSFALTCWLSSTVVLFVFWRIFLQLVLGDNDLLLALRSQMSPLRGFCIQEKQRSCGSLAPLFHFLLVCVFFLWMCKEKQPGFSHKCIFDAEDRVQFVGLGCSTLITHYFVWLDIYHQ